MWTSHAGELAALGAAGCWTISALAWEGAGRRIGVLSLNLIRLVLGFAFLTVYTGIFRGSLLPLDATPHAWLWLSLSAVVGFIFGDLCLFRAIVLIGPRLAILVMSATPVWTALLAFPIVGEKLEALDLLGMALTVGGISWAVLERQPKRGSDKGAPSLSVWGVVLALGGSLGQAGGLVLSKYGMQGYDPFAATQVRAIAAIAGFAVVITIGGWWPRVGRALKERVAMRHTLVGSCFGPFLGVALSLVAVNLTAAGIAASIMAITPILMLPIARIRGEQIGVGGVLGATFAVGGVVLLFR